MHTAIILFWGWAVNVLFGHTLIIICFQTTNFFFFFLPLSETQKLNHVSSQTSLKFHHHSMDMFDFTSWSSRTATLQKGTWVCTEIWQCWSNFFSHFFFFEKISFLISTNTLFNFLLCSRKRKEKPIANFYFYYII